MSSWLLTQSFSPTAPSFPVPYTIDALASAHHTHTVIFLHGRDCDGEELASAINEVRIPGSESLGYIAGSKGLLEAFPNIRWVFPSARRHWSTEKGRYVREWYEEDTGTSTPSSNHNSDNNSSSSSSNVDLTVVELARQEEFRRSVKHIHRVLATEFAILGGDRRRVLLAGYGQGESVALINLLTTDMDLGAFIGYGGWMPLATEMEIVIEGLTREFELPRRKLKAVSSMLMGGLYLNTSRQTNTAPETRILIGHGKEDEVVNVGYGRQVRDILDDFGYAFLWKEYEGAPRPGHWFKDPDAFSDMMTFIYNFVQGFQGPGF